MLSAGVIALAILVVLALCAGVWFGYYLVLQNGRLMLRLESLEQRLTDKGVLSQGMLPGQLGMPPGSVLNDFALPQLDGGTMTLSQWRGRRVALLFLSPRCSHCQRLLPDLAAMQSAGPETDPAIVIISTGSVEENRQFFGPHHLTGPILLQEDNELAAFYLAMATPMAYLVNEQGVTVGHAAMGPAAILEMLRSQGEGHEGSASAPAQEVSKGALASSHIKRDGLKAGTPAPEFTLPALDGKEISLRSFRGRPLLLVFSDPNCRPCNELLPKLEAFHRQSTDLRVLVISRGDPEANREKVKKLGVTLPVVLQRSWEISRAYGMFSTPIGYLLDEDGVVVEDVAVGGNRILALAAQQRNPVLGARS